MGYRQYFYIIDKEVVEKVHKYGEAEFVEFSKINGIIYEDRDEEWSVMLHKLGEEVHDFGKYYENSKEVQKTGKPLFKDKELQKMFEEYEPFIVGKEAILNVIEYQRELIIKYYKTLLETTEEELEEEYQYKTTKLDMYESHIREMYREWDNPVINGTLAINLYEDTDVITTSWKYEYSIFELVRLYKAIDWDTKRLLFMGW